MCTTISKSRADLGKSTHSYTQEPKVLFWFCGLYKKCSQFCAQNLPIYAQ